MLEGGSRGDWGGSSSAWGSGLPEKAAEAFELPEAIFNIGPLNLFITEPPFCYHEI